MKTAILLSDIFEYFKDTDLIDSQFGGNPTITGIQSVELCGPGQLVFVDRENYINTVNEQKPAAVVTTQALADRLAENRNLGILITPNVKLAQALVKTRFGDRDFDEEQWDRIHPSATVHPTAIVGETASIGPNAVIGKGVRVGPHTRILGGVVVEHDAVIGENCVIHPNAVIGYRCQIGNRVEIGGGSIIGSEGYGFAQDDSRVSYKIPQTGIVVIADDVRIGANNCVDRATYAETRIGRGTKTDNLCHIAHNVQIGENCLLTAMLCVAGSTKIGNRVVASGQTGILDHVTICDDVYLLQRAGVSKDINRPGAYAGTPVQPLNEYMRTLAHERSIGRLKEKLAALEQAIERLQNPPSASSPKPA
ncbi:MAG: UDP-3-O-(3-hydroxymyristoyl)glucosamine N-acyltransferase [Verrucomicrobiota bacterium]|nr:UDP-3-O-(3-hydroxymyristoyl)glucosamine N-acyltransferase [Verrucomicrobiota bacterium]